MTEYTTLESKRVLGTIERSHGGVMSAYDLLRAINPILPHMMMAILVDGIEKGRVKLFRGRFNGREMNWFKVVRKGSVKSTVDRGTRLDWKKSA